MTIEGTDKNGSAVSGATVVTSPQATAVGPSPPYRTFNQLMRGLLAAVLMMVWAVILVCGIFLIHPDTRQPSGVLTVLAIPILLVSALPVVYRYWVKNWRTM